MSEMESPENAEELSESMNRKFTLWKLWKFVFPSVFCYMFVAVYQTVDGFFIGRYVGELALSTVNLCYPVITLFFAVGSMLGAGGNALILYELGAGRKEEALRIFSETIEFGALLSILLTVLAFVFGDPIMRFCGASDVTIVYLRPYYYILSAGALAIVFQALIAALIIGEGHSEIVAVVAIVSGLLNCGLDYLFMGRLHMGIKGAAIATLFGYLMVLVFAIYYYVARQRSLFRLRWTAIRRKKIDKVLVNGSSEMITDLSGCVVALAMNHLAYRFYGDPGISVLTVFFLLQFLTEAGFEGMSAAVEPVFSYHYGAGNAEKKREAVRTSLKLTLLMAMVVALFAFLFRGMISGVFFEKGTEMYAISVTAILWLIPGILFEGFNILISGMFTAFSNGVVSAALSVTRTFFLVIGCLFFFSYLLGAVGMWAAWGIAEFLALLMSFFFFRKYRKRYGY